VADPRDHAELGKLLRLFDFEAAAKLSGFAAPQRRASTSYADYGLS
jgi:hypothetical protein